MSDLSAYRYGVFDGDGSGLLVEQPWFIFPERARAHVGHRCTVSIYGGQNLAIECEDCFELIGDIDFIEKEAER